MITSESARYLMARTNLAFEHPELAASLGGAAKCWSCKIGLNVALGATIAAAIAAAVVTGGLAVIPARISHKRVSRGEKEVIQPINWSWWRQTDPTRVEIPGEPVNFPIHPRIEDEKSVIQTAQRRGAAQALLSAITTRRTLKRICAPTLSSLSRIVPS
jgi:hypothetical protein